MTEVRLSYPEFPFQPGTRVIINGKIIDSDDLEAMTLVIQKGKMPQLDLRYSWQSRKEKDILE